MVALSTNMIKFYDIQNAPKRKEEKNHILDSNSIKEDDRHIFSLISQPVGWFFIKSVQLHKLLLQTFFFLIFFLLYKKTSYRVRILTMQKQLESARKYFFNHGFDLLHTLKKKMPNQNWEKHCCLPRQWKQLECRIDAQLQLQPTWLQSLAFVATKSIKPPFRTNIWK